MEYSYTSQTSLFDILGVAGSIAYIVICLILMVLQFASMWILFTKAGEKGWHALVPVYNMFRWYKIVWGGSYWMLLLMFVPIVNFVFAIMLLNNISKAYGHGVGFTVLLLFFSSIMYMILAFGSSQYIGPKGLPK